MGENTLGTSDYLECRIGIAKQRNKLAYGIHHLLVAH